MTKEPMPSAYAGAYDAAAAIANDPVERTKGQVKAAAAQATAKAKELYGEARHVAADQMERGRDLVLERPYAAVGAALITGLVIGMAMASGRPRVIYLKDR